MASLKETHVVFQLPNVGSWFENIAVRSTGTVLATRLDAPELWEINPATGTGTVIATFPPPVASVSGITELAPDVFALGAGQYNLNTGPVQGSFSIWTLDLSSSSADGTYSPKLVTQIPEAALINGLTTGDAAKGIVLGADSALFAVYKIHIPSGTYTKVLEDETMTTPPGAPLQIGINGAKMRNGHLYFTNTMRETFYRVPVGEDFKATGAVEEVATGFPQDDFVFGANGTAYITTHGANTVVEVALGSKEGVAIAGNFESLEVAGCTACALGRGQEDGKVLYVSTGGALAMPVKGTQVEPAKVVAVRLE
jgi:hypothetical protein